MQVETPGYKVIYPVGMDSLAKRYLWLLEQNRVAVMAGLGGINPKQIPVLLNNRTARSNGTVVWAPKRMELYTIPPTDNYPQAWDRQLAIHESRHVGQMTWFTTGFYKCLGMLIGQQSPSLGVAIYPSRWMLEGDAVVAETELSNTGRGRNAEFMEYYRTAALEGENRKWNQWRLGSYKRYTPNHYAFGYLLNSTIRYITGNYHYAGEVFDGLVKNFYNPNVTGKSYRQSVGNKPQHFFALGYDMMGQMWKKESSKRGNFTVPEQLLLEKGKDYREYYSPVGTGADSLLYVRYSYNNPSQLVLVHDGKEKVLKAISAGTKGLQRHGDLIYYAANNPSARWSKEVFSDIYAYNLKSGRTTRITDGGYYFSPMISLGGDSLLVEEYLPQGGSRLAILDSRTGKPVAMIPAPYGGQITESTWLAGSIYALIITENGLGLYRTDNSGVWENIIADQNASITDLKATDCALYFLSDMDGVRNVYMFHPMEGKLQRLTNSEYGASEPYIYNGALYYSAMHLNGKYPVRIQLDSIAYSGSEYEPLFVVEDSVSSFKGRIHAPYKYVVAEALAQQAKNALGEQYYGEKLVTEEEFANRVQARKYSKAGHLLRFHSWAPVYYNVDRIMDFDFDQIHRAVALGATAYSQNTLGTATTMLGYSYHKGFHAGHLKFKYSGWYPVLQISADVNADQRYMVKLEKGDSTINRVMQPVGSPLVELEAITYIPFNFSSNGWQRGVVPQVGWNFNNNGHYDSAKGGYIYSNTLTGALQAYTMREMAPSGIYPKWGLGTVAKWRTAINGGENFGSAASLYLYGYAPGVAPTHGIKLSLSLQKQNVEGKNYYGGNMVSMPRGFEDQMYGEKYCMATADYAFPVYMGDMSLLGLAYLKRMQVIPYADIAALSKSVGKGKLQHTALYSYGGAILFDLCPFMLGVDISIGVRYSRYGQDVAGAATKWKNGFGLMVSTSLF